MEPSEDRQSSSEGGVPRWEIGELLSFYPEDKPPQLRVTLKKTSDIQVISKDLNDADHLPIDILLVTVEECEFLSCLPFLDLHFKSYISEIGFVYFGCMGGYSCHKNLKVGLICCSKGSTVPGGPLPKVQTAMRILQPKAVVSVGICSSLVPEKVKMGDVVIPSKLISADGSFHVPVSPRFNGLVQDAPYGWVAPLKNQGELEVKVHRDGDVLSQSMTGKSRCDILKQYPGAVASGTECKDVCSAGYLANTEWVVVKGVASYFHQSESSSSEWMSFASTMAASVVVKMLNDPRVFLEWPHCSQVTPLEISLRGPRALEAYNKALEEGKTRLKRIPIMLIGQDRSGKTSLKKSLQGLRFNPKENSTDGIDVDPSHFKVTTEIWKAGKKDQAANKEEMAISFEHRVARVVFENLRQQKLTSEAKIVDKAKVLETSPAISTEAYSVRERNEIFKDLTELSPAINHDQVGLSADSSSTTQIKTKYSSADSLNSSGVAQADGGSRVFQTKDNYQTETKARDNNVSSGVIPKEIETLIRELGDRVDQMESEDYLYSVFWDFAGESVYYETHQLFLTSRAVYLLVYDLSRDPEEIAQPVEKQGVFEKSKETFCTKTNRDYLDYWMTSVSSQSSPIEDHNLPSASTSTIVPKKLTPPPVLLVCTHSDKPFGGKNPSDLAIKLYGSLATKPYKTQLYDKVFVVDNTKSGLEMEEVQRLRKSILDVIKDLPHTNEYMPIKWLRYEKALKVVLDEGHKRITFEHARQIASEVCQIHDHQEFVTVLDFLHDQRIIIHFDDTVELNKLVVLDPQWLIDVFKTVITVKRFDHIESGFMDLWLKLENDGILEEKLLKHMWGSLAKEYHTFESLIAIMENFSLLCAWSSSDEPFSCKKYLVPSMLKYYPTQEFTKLITSASLPSLFVKFESGQSPSNLFPRLVVQFLKWGRKTFWSTENPRLFKNFARLYTKSQKCSVVLLCHSSLIEVVVHGGNDPSLKDDFQANLGNSPSDQCNSLEVLVAREIFGQLMVLLECFRKEFSWLKRMKYQAGVICPVCCHERIVKYCTTHHKQDCNREECLHFIPGSELRNANQPITCTRSPAAVDKVGMNDFSAWFPSLRAETTTDAISGRLLCSPRG
ncbi:PREDICTED: uncharacterized protein LOC107338244 isoform X2 [Acropora digitifera]|nr:PREDICTED: uncharacterized protein LOC107338244 isoform X2 [Acropora digitifera]